MSKSAFCGPVFVLLFALLAGCSDLPSKEDNDPLESFNRKTHTFNVRLDKSVLQPVSLAYVNTVNKDFRTALGNAADNIQTPAHVVNNILQGRIDVAVENSLKFVLNTTVGIGGLGTPAQELGIHGDESGFGKTLHVWGVSEGPYIVLPILGPSTSRDAVGKLGDFTLNPLNIFPHQDVRWARSGMGVVNGLNARGEYDRSISELLYHSADSYEQLKLFYLQSRRFELDGIDEEDYFDPYEDDLFEDQ